MSSKEVATTLHPSIPVPLYKEGSGASAGRNAFQQALEKAMPRNEALLAKLPPKIDPLTRVKGVRKLTARQQAIKEEVREVLMQAIRLSTNFVAKTKGKELSVIESGTITKHIQAAIQVKNFLMQPTLVYDKSIIIFLETSFEKKLFDAYNIKTIGKLCSMTREDIQSLEESLIAVGMKMPIFVKALYYGEL